MSYKTLPPVWVGQQIRIDSSETEYFISEISPDWFWVKWPGFEKQYPSLDAKGTQYRRSNGIPHKSWHFQPKSLIIIDE